MKRILVWETLAIVGGGQKMTLLIVDMLRKKYDVHILLPKIGPLAKELDKMGISYTCIGDQSLPFGYKGLAAIFKYLKISVRTISAFIRLTREQRPDLVYIPGPAALPLGAICGQLAKVPVIWHIHHIFIDSKTKYLINVFSAWKIVKRIITVSDCVGRQIVNKKGVEKLMTLYNPVDAAWYSSGISRVIEDEIGLTKNDSLWIGHIGILQPSKRQDFVLRVVNELLRRGLNVHGLIVGSAREDTKDYELKLNNLIKSMGLSSYIHMLGHRKDINNVLASLELLMIPSLEGFPLVGLEALAAGVPIVAYNDGGSKEIVDMSSAGITYNEFDDESLAADAIEKMLLNEEYEDLQHRGKQFALRHSYEQYEQILFSEFNACIITNS